MSLQITNLQRFSLYDGPGIRTTVFLKGCSLKCPWCCNPENIKKKEEFYFKAGDCIRCGECLTICPERLLSEPEDILKLEGSRIKECITCRKCVETCPTKSLGIYGEKITHEALLNVIQRDKEFYSQNNGGVTFSGGEPLLQAYELLNVLEKLKEENIHIAVETSLFAPLKCLKLIEDLVDLFIIDIKILDEDSCLKNIKGDFKTFGDNIEEIMRKNKSYIFRFPLVKPLTFNEKNITYLYDFIKGYNIKYLEIFKTHTLASDKYESLGLKPKLLKK